jgi:hypothetical protein
LAAISWPSLRNAPAPPPDPFLRLTL